MARAPRRYRSPIVITIAALGSACGNGPDYVLDQGGDGDGDLGSGGTASGGRSGSGGSVVATGGGTIASGGASLGTGGRPDDLPACSDESSYSPSEMCEPLGRCTRTRDCTSGEQRTFVLTCSETGTARTFDEASCDLPYEFCSGDGGPILCTGEGEWRYEGQGGNPPGPCPPTAPMLGSACVPGGSFGADRDACGYPCADGGWTIIGCVGDPLSDGGMWLGDGACEPNMGGAGGGTPE